MQDKTKSAVYIRVSTNSSTQIHSFDYQAKRWREFFDANPHLQLVKIYADKGISGKAQKNRKQFLNMVEAAKRGEFTTVFTKSVARFGRDTEELLRSVNELKDIGVNVIFDTENIDTAVGGSELYLAVAAAIAEDQLRTNATRASWTMRDKFAKGELVIGNIYGYKLNKGKLEVIENEAAVVRLIFQLYLKGKGRAAIANELLRLGIPPPKGGDRWSETTLRGILLNEKYAGHCLLQKGVKIDGITYKNQNIIDKYFYPNTHEAIVTQADWDKVQAEMTLRCGEKKEYSPPPEYAFTAKVQCGFCGKSYRHKNNNAGSAYSKGIWRCQTYERQGVAVCQGRGIFDEVLEPLFLEAYNEFIATRNKFVIKTDNTAAKDKLLEDERKLMSLKARGLISLDDYKEESEKILAEIKTLDALIKREAMNDVSGKSAKPMLAFDGEAVKEYLERAVMGDGTVTFEFINGCTITKPYSNGRGGNQKGWRIKQAEKQERRAN